MRVKATKERCLKCRYVMNLTGASMVKKGDSGALIACGYSLKNDAGECRSVKAGKKREDFEVGYCKFFEEGNRKNSRDALLNKDRSNTTVNKRRSQNA